MGGFFLSSRKLMALQLNDGIAPSVYKCASSILSLFIPCNDQCRVIEIALGLRIDDEQIIEHSDQKAHANKINTWPIAMKRHDNTWFQACSPPGSLIFQVAHAMQILCNRDPGEIVFQDDDKIYTVAGHGSFYLDGTYRVISNGIPQIALHHAPLWQEYE